MRRRSLSTPTARGGKVFPNSRYGRPNQRPRRQGQYINPERFINKAAPVEAEAEFVPTHNFGDFGLLPELVRNLTDRGYQTPTPVQDQAIGLVVTGRDVVGLANTGTGKTAAFALPMIHRLKTDLGGRTGLIIAPTRELASQIEDEIRGFARGLGIYSALCVGGANINRQIEALRRRPQIVIGTPGRLKDLLGQGELKFDRVGMVVLDEADRMLDMGFIRDIQFLLAALPPQRQSLCFSATIPPEIKRLIDSLLTNPVTVSVRTRETSDHVEQDVIETVSKDHKIEVLTELLRRPDFDKVLVFGQTKWSVQRLAETLSKHGFKAVAIHGNKSQPQRQRALDDFKAGRARVLVATDVAARGLDIPGVREDLATASGRRRQ